MKKFIAALIVIMLATTGCSIMAGNDNLPSGTGEASQAVEPVATSEPTPEPTPAPRNVAVVSDCTEDESALFFEGVKAWAEENTPDFELQYFADADINTYIEDEQYIGVISLVTDQATQLPADAAKPVAAYTAYGQPAGTTAADVLYYEENGDVVTRALDEAIEYWPHDTPVRLLAMVESESSDGAAAYKTRCDEGKVLDKGEYIKGTSDKTPAEWMASMLDNYIEGMLDAVYCENEELALAALDALESANRTDLEVISAGVSATVLERMTKNPDVFAVTIGADHKAAGSDRVAKLAELFAGGTAGTLAQEAGAVTMRDAEAAPTAAPTAPPHTERENTPEATQTPEPSASASAEPSAFAEE